MKGGVFMLVITELLQEGNVNRVFFILFVCFSNADGRVMACIISRAVFIML